jgi:serine protease Do
MLAVALVAALLASGITWFAARETVTPNYVFAQGQEYVSLTFAPMVKKVVPAVVSVVSEVKPVRTSNRDRQQMPPGLPPGLEDFFGDFFGRGGPGMPEPRPRRGQGSGVVVTPDGYILTNNHVVEDADEVRIILNDRREFQAKVIGTDPPTDIAVVKIDAKALPVLPISDSAKVQVGDLALAVGNPFGLEQTVTMGIIGATGRSGIHAGGYEDFIQTDAAINPGNSGGALVNTNGQLIGINTAILSRSGGNQGIGFAIPINMAREVMDQLIKTGKVTRGYMGAYLQELTPELQKAFKLPKLAGAVVTQVEPGAPAAKAGVQAGDVITELNGQPVNDVNDLRLRVSRTPPGQTVKLTVQRPEGPQEIAVTLGTLPRDAGSARPDRTPEGGQSSALEGVSVDELTPQLAQQLQIPANVKGVVVTDVDSSSPAAEAGLSRGDVIMQVNRKDVSTVSEFQSAIRGTTGNVLLLVSSRGGTRFIVVEPSK